MESVDTVMCLLAFLIVCLVICLWSGRRVASRHGAGGSLRQRFSAGHAQPRALPVAPLPVARTKLETCGFGA